MKEKKTCDTLHITWQQLQIQRSGSNFHCILLLIHSYIVYQKIVIFFCKFYYINPFNIFYYYTFKFLYILRNLKTW